MELENKKRCEMEYEYSYVVSDLTEYLNYIATNYSFQEKTFEQRDIYRNKNHTIARITHKKNKLFLDFKEDKLEKKDCIERKESKVIQIDSLENGEDILAFLGYSKDNSMKRVRSIYQGEGITFEVDEYEEPKQTYVVSFEGKKEICDKVHKELESLNKKYKIEE